MTGGCDAGAIFLIERERERTNVQTIIFSVVASSQRGEKCKWDLFSLLSSIREENIAGTFKFRYFALLGIGFLNTWGVVSCPVQDETAQGFDAELLGGLLLLYLLPGD